jgi:hypothetical protein
MNTEFVFEPEQSPEPTATPTPVTKTTNKTNGPKTGDETNLVAPITLLVVSGLAASKEGAALGGSFPYIIGYAGSPPGLLFCAGAGNFGKLWNIRQEC